MAANRRGVRHDEDGGETITVTVSRNGQRLFQRSATITGTGEGQRRYTTDDGQVVRHVRSAGFKALAIRLLNL